MKSDTSIKGITIAAIKRSAIDINNWALTKINPEQLLPGMNPEGNELPVVYVSLDENNWTLITTRKIIGMLNGTMRQIHFINLDDIVWGNFKSTKSSHTIFRVTDIYGDQIDFLMETGNPSLACIKGIQTIERFYKNIV